MQHQKSEKYCQIYSNLETFKYSPEKNFGAYFHLPEIYKVSINRTLINVNLYLSNLLLLVCIKVLEETKNKKTKAQKNCPLCKSQKKIIIISYIKDLFQDRLISCFALLPITLIETIRMILKYYKNC